MAMSIIIRPAQRKDAQVIADYVAAMALETEDLLLHPEVVSLGVEAVFADPSRGLYVVAAMADKIIGQAMITYEWSDWNNANRWWIQSVFVAPEFRRQGVYSKLFEYFKLRSREAGDVCEIRLYVHEDNRVAQSVYQRLGMNRTRYILYKNILE
jgi:ribosomal protein S18 acetylase RimI-like enzyme